MQGRYTLVLANPPFAGSLDYESCAKDLQQIVKTKKTELLFLALFLRLLKPGGRAAVIVPDGVLFGSTKAHKELRRMLVEEQKLDAVIYCRRRIQALRRGLHCHPTLYQDQRWRHRSCLVLRRGSRRLVSRRQATAAAVRGKARSDATGWSSPTRSTAKTICPTSSCAGRNATAVNAISREPSRASVCRKPKSSSERLRSLAQPIQGKVEHAEMVMISQTIIDELEQIRDRNCRGN